ncbi:MAG: hypothetical protein R3C05_14985 [Pirellulaceae bacterium]
MSDIKELRESVKARQRMWTICCERMGMMSLPLSRSNSKRRVARWKETVAKFRFVSNELTAVESKSSTATSASVNFLPDLITERFDCAGGWGSLRSDSIAS